MNRRTFVTQSEPFSQLRAHDPFFIPAGAEAYRRDNPHAVVQLLDTGHFALETHVEEIALATKQFLAKKSS